MQWQIRAYYANGAIFSSGIEAPDLASARKKAEEIGPPGKAMVEVTQIPQKKDR